MDTTPLQGNIPDFIYNEIGNCEFTFGINTELRLAHFLGQCDHESGGFAKFEENLNYSGEALWLMFSKHFSSASEALTFARQPERIANRIYANRLGNGDENSGDGWLHRGMGAIQITGKTNQQAFFKSIGLSEDSDPHLIADTYKLESAAYYWGSSNLNKIADTGIGNDVITTITKIINGGLNGIDDRINKVNKYYNLLVPTIVKS